MPQVFEVLRCYKCFVFQVHQTKKANKFVCKMCGEKQSIKRNYGIGTGKECRVHVQKLNGIRKELDESKPTEGYPTSEEDDNSELSVVENLPKKESKWSDYVNVPENVDTNSLTDDKMFLDDTEVVLEVPKRKRHKQSIVNYNNKTSNTKSETNVENTDADCPKSSTNFRSSNLDINVHSKQNLFSVPIKQDELVTQSTYYDNKYSQNINLQDEIAEFESIDCTTTLNNSPVGLNHKNVKQKFDPPVVNENSKWFQFTETDLTEVQNNTTPEIDSLSDNIESQLQKEMHFKENNDQSYYSDPDSAKSDSSNFVNENCNECISNGVNKNSKWIELTQKHSDSSENNLKCFIKTEQRLQNDPHSFFSPCDDDSEIDNLLDI